MFSVFASSPSSPIAQPEFSASHSTNCCAPMAAPAHTHSFVDRPLIDEKPPITEDGQHHTSSKSSQDVWQPIQDNDEEVTRSRDTLQRAMDRLCIAGVIIVDSVLLMEVLGPWPRAWVLMFYFPSGVFLELCAGLVWIAARAGPGRDRSVETRATLSAWALFGLASLFLFQAYTRLSPAQRSESIVPALGNPLRTPFLAYIALLCLVWGLGVLMIVRAACTRGRRMTGL